MTGKPIASLTMHAETVLLQLLLHPWVNVSCANLTWPQQVNGKD